MTIEAQIKERQEEGKKLFYPAKMLALHLGTKYPKKHGAIMRFSAGINQEFFTIHYDTFAPNLTVFNYDENVVLNFHLGSITTYKRGPWVYCLQELAKPVIKGAEMEKEREKLERERKRLEDWGL